MPLAVALAGTMTVASAAAQGVPPPAITVPPVNVVIPNYSSVPVGEIGSLEANAYLVRADASSAAWYNPAGLTLAEKSWVSGSAGVFQFGRVNPAALRSTGASFQQVPSLVSFGVHDLFGRKGWAGGFSMARVNAWSQSVDTEREFGTADADERVRYSSPATMSGWMASLGVGHRVSGKARAGASGYATDRSPAGPGDTYFTKVHMQVLTAGISGCTSFLLGSVAVRYEAGTSADVILRQLHNGQQITTRFSVSTIGIVYSLALLF